MPGRQAWRSSPGNQHLAGRLRATAGGAVLCGCYYDTSRRSTDQIEIPFPQRDLHIQDIDRLADLMSNDAKTDGSTRRQRNNPKDGPPASQKGQDAPT